MLIIPSEVLSNLESGGFTVSLKGHPCHSDGVDEAHEMCINKDCNEFITRPSADYINRTVLFIPVRAEAIKKFEGEIFADKEKKLTVSIHIFVTSKPIKSLKKMYEIRLKNLKLVLSLTNKTKVAYAIFSAQNPSQLNKLKTFSVLERLDKVTMKQEWNIM